MGKKKVNFYAREWIWHRHMNIWLKAWNLQQQHARWRLHVFLVWMAYRPWLTHRWSTWPGLLKLVHVLMSLFLIEHIFSFLVDFCCANNQFCLSLKYICVFSNVSLCVCLHCRSTLQGKLFLFSWWCILS